MRSEDETLAHRLMTLRTDLRDLRLHRSSSAARELIEEAIDAQTESGALSKMADIVAEQQIDPTLRNCGVTKNNIMCRRFSVL